MNIQQATENLMEKMRAGIRRLALMQPKSMIGRSWARLDWRVLLSMDLSDALTSIFKILKKNGQKGDFQLKAIEFWPLWFRLSLLLAVILLGVGLIAVPVWSVALNDLSQKNAESEILKSRYKHLTSEANLLDQYRERVAVLDERFGEMLEMIPAELEMVQVLNQFSRIAIDSGMQLELFKPEAELREESYAILPVHMKLSGTFAAAARFLEAVSGMKHLVTVDVLLESAGVAPGRVLLSAKIKAYRGDSTRHFASGFKEVGLQDAAR